MSILKENRALADGITLIALVVTIVVLLILAGVTMTMVIGSNGIITKSQISKENMQRAEVIERAKIDLIGLQVENKGEDITKAQLKTVLDKYFTDVPEEVPGDIAGLTLTTKPEYGSYSIRVTDIYNGTIENVGTTYRAYNVGDQVTVTSTGESFYVIKASGASEEKVTLLAAKNIDTSSMKQSDSAGAVAFSSAYYWAVPGTTYPCDLNNMTTSADTDAIAKARAYGVAQGGIGRLMTVEEVNELGENNGGTPVFPSWINQRDYWLSIAGTSVNVWSVKGVKGCLEMTYIGSNLGGVRPVVEISKSLVS